MTRARTRERLKEFQDTVVEIIRDDSLSTDARWRRLMAMWEDPLDDLIAELERVVPPEPPETKPGPQEFLRFLARVQADAAKIVFSPEATEPYDTAAPPAPLGPTGVPPQAPVSNLDSVTAQLYRLLLDKREGSG